MAGPGRRALSDAEHILLPVNTTSLPGAAELLRRHGIRPSRKLGQNFLDDPEALGAILAAADISPTETVLEIGCGLGHLTAHLAMRARRVVAVELDKRLASLAAQVLKQHPNVEVVNADILTVPTSSLGLPSDYVVTANIPYNITSPIIRRLMESDPRPARIVLTVQEEVAERICAQPPRMSILTLSVQVYGATRIAARIPAEAFFPAPKVDSAVVRIDVYPHPRIASTQLDAFFRLIKLSFAQKRKTLRNNLAAGLRIPPTRAAEIIRSAGLDPNLRAEALGFDEWTSLCSSPELASLLRPLIAKS